MLFFEIGIGVVIEAFTYPLGIIRIIVNEKIEIDYPADAHEPGL